MKEFTIPFVGLKEGKHNFEFGITKAFFDFFEYDEYCHQQNELPSKAEWKKITTTISR